MGFQSDQNNIRSVHALISNMLAALLAVELNHTTESKGQETAN